jgi:hypothetical protein
MWAGNRADVNADGVVNAGDLTVLGNLVAGNLDIGNYDLANVVVVAPQGGDFTSPLDAVNWVATQSPSNTKRFLVLVTPGVYHYTGQFMLPSYTTLCGYGPSNTRLIQDWAGYQGMYAYEVIDVSIANLQIEAPHWGDRRPAITCGWITGCPDGDIASDLYGIVCRSSNMEIVDCEVRATQSVENYAAWALLPYVVSEVQPPSGSALILSGVRSPAAWVTILARTPEAGWDVIHRIPGGDQFHDAAHPARLLRSRRQPEP